MGYKIETIKWEKQKKAIIKRVFERGSEAEKIEIKRVYGSAKIKRILHETAMIISSQLAFFIRSTFQVFGSSLTTIENHVH